MTILLVIKRFDFGGAENHVCDLANDLCEKGHNVILATGKGRQVEKLNPKIKYIPIKLTDFLIPCHILRLTFLIIRHNVDIIHAHQRLAILNACLAGFITRRKVISTVHGRTRYDLRHALSRRLSNKIIFVSKRILQISNRKYNFDGKSVFIPNGIRSVELLNNNPRPYRICYVSKINKSHFSFLKILINKVLPVLKGKYPQLEFWIIGDGKKITELKNLSEKLNIRTYSNFCKVLGYKSSLLPYYESTSLVMGVGRVALEASAAGVPVLMINSKRMGGMLTKENFKDIKHTNFVDTGASPPCKHSILTAIETFFNDQARLQQEAITLAGKIQKDLSSDLMSNKIISLYRNVIEKN